MSQRGKCRNRDGKSECERDLWRKRNRESLKERDKKRKGARDRKGGRIRGRDRKYSQTTQ